MCSVPRMGELDQGCSSVIDERNIMPDGSGPFVLVWLIGTALTLWVLWAIIRNAVKTAVIEAHRELRLDEWIEGEQDQRASRKSSDKPVEP